MPLHARYYTTISARHAWLAADMRVHVRTGSHRRVRSSGVGPRENGLASTRTCIDAYVASTLIAPMRRSSVSAWLATVMLTHSKYRPRLATVQRLFERAHPTCLSAGQRKNTSQSRFRNNPLADYPQPDRSQSRARMRLLADRPRLARGILLEDCIRRSLFGARVRWTVPVRR